MRIANITLPTILALVVIGLGVGCTTPDKWHFIGDENEIPFENNWRNLDEARQARYVKDADGTVYLEGIVIGGVSGTVVCVLPVGYLPSHPIAMSTGSRGEVAASLTISEAGEIKAWYPPGHGEVLLHAVFTTK